MQALADVARQIVDAVARRFASEPADEVEAERPDMESAVRPMLYLRQIARPALEFVDSEQAALRRRAAAVAAAPKAQQRSRFGAKPFRNFVYDPFHAHPTTIL